MKLPIIPQDKANHFIYGTAIFAITYMIMINFVFTLTAVATGMITTTLIAVAKELVDYLLNKRLVSMGLRATHGVELFDAVATVSGSVIPTLLLLATHYAY